MTDRTYVCDLCGYQSDRRDEVMNHVRDEHDLEPGEVGRVDQADGMVTLTQSDGSQNVIDLEQWLKTLPDAPGYQVTSEFKDGSQLITTFDWNTRMVVYKIIEPDNLTGKSAARQVAEKTSKATRKYSDD